MPILKESVTESKLTFPDPAELRSWHPASPELQQRQSGLTAGADDQRARKPGRFQPWHRFLCGVPETQQEEVNIMVNGQYVP